MWGRSTVSLTLGTPPCRLPSWSRQAWCRKMWTLFVTCVTSSGRCTPTPGTWAARHIQRCGGGVEGVWRRKCGRGKPGAYNGAVGCGGGLNERGERLYLPPTLPLLPPSLPPPLPPRPSTRHLPAPPPPQAVAFRARVEEVVMRTLGAAAGSETAVSPALSASPQLLNGLCAVLQVGGGGGGRTRGGGLYSLPARPFSPCPKLPQSV